MQPAGFPLLMAAILERAAAAEGTFWLGVGPPFYFLNMAHLGGYSRSGTKTESKMQKPERIFRHCNKRFSNGQDAFILGRESLDTVLFRK